MMGARSKINVISLNVKVNKQKSVDVCGYKLPINVQNFIQKDSAQATFFDSPCTLQWFLNSSVQQQAHISTCIMKSNTEH